MKINQKDMSYFHLKVNAFSIQPSTISLPFYQPENSLYPILGTVELQPKPMELKVEVDHKEDLSNLMAEVLSHKENVIDIDDSYLYHCFFTGANTAIEEYWQGKYRLSIPFMVIQCGHPQHLHVTSRHKVARIFGNWATSCNLKVVAHKDISSLEIMGMRIQSLESNKPIYVDGITKKIYDDEKQNRYGDCTLPDFLFPKLSPGIQTFHIPEDVEIEIMYHPLFV